MLALAIISTILLGLFTLLYISMGYDALKKRYKFGLIVYNIFSFINVFAIMSIWILYAS